MKQLFILALVLMLSITLSADWKALSSDSRGSSPLNVKLLGSTDKEIKVEITIPGYHEKRVQIGDIECLVIHIPGSAMYMQRGFPMVPQLAKLVKIEHDCEIKMEVVSKEEVDVPLSAPIVPSKGHFTRDIDPETVPFEFGPIYKQDVFWPAAEDQFKIGKNFQFRDNCGLRLQILPIRANHVQMMMKVLKKAVVVFKIEHNLMARSAARVAVSDRTFNKMSRDIFLQSEVVESYRGQIPDPENKNLFVVTPQKFAGLLGNWINWKKKCGYTVTVYEVQDGVTASTIKAELQKRYDNADSRFGYVVLIGDAGYVSNFEQAQPMPTFKGKKEGAAADRVYVRLAGNDNYPDAFISRISGTTNEEITNQLDKIVKYESAPEKGDWFVKGICIASNQGSPTDKERAEWLQNGGGSGQKVPVDGKGLIGYGYSSFTDIYDPYAYAEDVTNAVNTGSSIICYIGHGSSTSWGTTGFSVTDIHNLSNGGRLPVIWSVACVNGQFVHQKECFGEAWLRKANGGAAAIECASTNESWVPPCDKQCATINAVINKRQFTFGALEAVGCVKGLETWGDTDSSEGNKMAEQCNLFGDCTMMVRTKAPASVSVNMSRGLDNDLVFTVIAEDRAEQNATVTVYSEDLSYCVSGETGTDGTVNISLDNCPKCPLFYTVVGPDMNSVVDVPVE